MAWHPALKLFYMVKFFCSGNNLFLVRFLDQTKTMQLNFKLKSKKADINADGDPKPGGKFRAFHWCLTTCTLLR